MSATQFTTKYSYNFLRLQKDACGKSGSKDTDNTRVMTMPFPKFTIGRIMLHWLPKQILELPAPPQLVFSNADKFHFSTRELSGEGSQLALATRI